MIKKEIINFKIVKIFRENSACLFIHLRLIRMCKNSNLKFTFLLNQILIKNFSSFLFEDSLKLSEVFFFLQMFSTFPIFLFIFLRNQWVSVTLLVLRYTITYIYVHRLYAYTRRHILISKKNIVSSV